MKVSHGCNSRRVSVSCAGLSKLRAAEGSLLISAFSGDWNYIRVQTNHADGGGGAQQNGTG